VTSAADDTWSNLRGRRKPVLDVGDGQCPGADRVKLRPLARPRSDDDLAVGVVEHSEDVWLRIVASRTIGVPRSALRSRTPLRARRIVLYSSERHSREAISIPRRLVTQGS
jgi:hypothetical protein